MSWGVLAIMCIAAFIQVFDTTAMTVAISDLVKDLKFAKTYGWFYAKQPPVSGGIEIAPFGLSITPILLFGLSITPILLLAGIILFACFRLFYRIYSLVQQWLPDQIKKALLKK